MEFSAALIIRIIVAVVLAVIFGNGSVVLFNRVPARWFEDYDEEDIKAGRLDAERKVLPPKLLEADSMGRQRLPSTPWKYAFTGYFAICGIYMAIRGSGLAFEIFGAHAGRVRLCKNCISRHFDDHRDRFAVIGLPFRLLHNRFRELCSRALQPWRSGFPT